MKKLNDVVVQERKPARKNKGVTFKWCPICKVVYVECPTCGNNSCNGGHGKIEKHGVFMDCPDCHLAYKVQDQITAKMEKALKVLLGGK